ncbi:WD40 repeat-like protein [Saitoella complicata NRRL Y-17804]|nr:WD40 repeat-like protein [Saitoella complicata NRRL Y-17804]ODQ53555.1 WD40 repeat-like protein [Saitoella complicata NRRL Y-17804]
MSGTLSPLQSTPFNPASLTYVLSLTPFPTHSLLIASGSDNSLRTFSLPILSPLSSIPQAHADSISAVCAYDEHHLVTAGKDRVVRMWDVRSTPPKCVMEYRAEGARKPQGFTSLAVQKRTGRIAAGTELVGVDAPVYIWDANEGGKPVRAYTESHNDDVTVLAFYPNQDHLLLSGSCDGLVSIFDLNVEDEDDAVLQVVNHNASIHRAGFLASGDAFFALSHMETFTIFPLRLETAERDVDDVSAEVKPIEFGDLRQVLGCDYVQNFDPVRGRVVVGSHEEGWVDIVSFDSATGKFGERWRMGGHDGEVARDLIIDEANAVVVSGGEDGTIKSWKAGGEISAQPTTAEVGKDQDGKKKKEKKDKKDRYKPY